MEHSFEQLNVCPCCRHAEHRTFLSCTDHSVSGTLFNITECAACGHRFTNPRPSVDDIGPYYKSEDYVSHNDTSKGLLFTLYQTIKSFTLKRKARFIQSISQHRSLLDYGAGSGDFAGCMSALDHSVTAFEPDPDARGLLISKYPNVKVAPSLSYIPDNSLGVITLWHVLEHVHALDETIQHFHRMLKADGVLIIAVPNCGSYDASYYRSHWAAYDVPRHLYHFRPADMKLLLARNGFKLTAMRPMWFDSFYVGLLSERYLKASNKGLPLPLQWLRAGFIGLFSNLKALNDTSTCSSVVYVLRKD